MEKTHWSDNAPAMLLETFTGPDGEPCFTTSDRRWLWHLENQLMVLAPVGSSLERLQRDLSQYLRETCEHHWKHYAGDEHIPEHHQCLWCNDVDWAEDKR